MCHSVLGVRGARGCVGGGGREWGVGGREGHHLRQASLDNTLSYQAETFLVNKSVLHFLCEFLTLSFSDYSNKVQSKLDGNLASQNLQITSARIVNLSHC